MIRALAILLSPLLAACTSMEPRPSELQDRLDEVDKTFRSHRYAESEKAAMALAVDATQAGATPIRVEALSIAVRGSLLADRHDEARTRLEEAGSMADPEETHSWARYRVAFGIVLRDEGRKEEALACFDELYHYCLRHEMHSQAIDAAHHAAIVAPLREQEAWAHRGIEAAEAGKMTGWLAVLWNNLGATYEEQELHAKALGAYEKARHYHHQGDNLLRKRIADWAVGRTLRKLGRLEESRAVLEPNLQAFRDMREGDETGQVPTWIGWAAWELGAIELEEGKREAARKLLLEAKEVLEPTGLAKNWKERWAELEALLAELDK